MAADTKLADPHTRQSNLLYLNYWQNPAMFQEWPQLQIRYVGSTASVISGARRELQVEGHEYVESFNTMADQLDMVLLRDRLLASVGVVFGVIALLLAGIGLFSLLSFFVSSRAKEIALRMALGAQHEDVVRMVIGEGAVLAGTGIVVGIGGGLVLARFLHSLLFGMDSMYPATFAGVAATLLVLALIACYVPARRAMRVDPMIALRHE